MSSSGIDQILDPNYIDTFVQAAFIKKDMEMADHPELVAAFTNYLTNKFDDYIVDHLSDQDLITLVEMKNNPNNAQITQFLFQKIPDLENQLNAILHQALTEQLA